MKWTDVIPPKWLAAAGGALLACAVLVWLALTVSAPQLPDDTLVTDTQLAPIEEGAPDPGPPTSDPCLDFQLSVIVASSSAFSEEFRADVLADLGQDLSEAAAQTEDVQEADALGALGSFLESDQIQDLSADTFALEDQLLTSRQLDEVRPDLDGVVTDFLGDC